MIYKKINDMLCGCLMYDVSRITKGWLEGLAMLEFDRKLIVKEGSAHEEEQSMDLILNFKSRIACLTNRF